MVFVLFLISVGVLEAILRWPRVATPRRRMALPESKRDSKDVPANTEDLLSLASALGSSVPTVKSPKIAGSQTEPVEKLRSSRLD